jgi:TonB family protein
MLRVLIASQPAKAGWLGGTSFSTVTHGALIALAIVSSGKNVPTVSEERAAVIERVTYVETARWVPSRRSVVARESSRRSTPSVPLLSQTQLSQLGESAAFAEKPPEIPDITAAPDLTSVSDAWLAQPDGIAGPTTTMASLVLAKTGFIPPANGVYTSDMVEHSVEPRRGNPKPRYPRELVRQGVEGEFEVHFVVDSTGKIVEDKIEFPGTMHRLFAAAVRTALLKSHYNPAMIAGRRVSQEVVQEFRFLLRQAP